MTARRQPEGKLSDAIREVLALERGLLLWRNSQGIIRQGKRVYRTGLGVGSADLVGVITLIAKRTWGRFIALEIKLPGEQPTDAQRAWLEHVRAHGGFAAVVRSVEEARAAVARARAGEAS